MGHEKTALWAATAEAYVYETAVATVPKRMQGADASRSAHVIRQPVLETREKVDVGSSNAKLRLKQQNIPIADRPMNAVVLFRATESPARDASQTAAVRAAHNTMQLTNNYNTRPQQVSAQVHPRMDAYTRTLFFFFRTGMGRNAEWILCYQLVHARSGKGEQPHLRNTTVAPIFFSLAQTKYFSRHARIRVAGVFFFAEFLSLSLSLSLSRQ
jgi:hypothetical protein